MKLLQNILVVVDFKESTPFVIDSAVQLAQKFDSQITLMHVIVEQNIDTDISQLLFQTLEKKLEGYKLDIEHKGVLVKQVILEKGVAFEQIIQKAQSNDYNVIIAGAGSHDLNETYKLGTTAEKLMRKNQVPLWIVKKQKDSEIKKIVCPVDTSDASKRALQNAITLAEKFDAELSIVNVYSPVNYYSMRFETDNEKENIIRKQKQEKELFGFLKLLNLSTVKHQVHVLEGEPFLEILKFIKLSHADLLLMGTTGRSGLSRLLMGSVTEKVTREVPCNFVTTKARDLTDSYFESNLKSLESVLNVARDSLAQKQYEKAEEQFIMTLKQYPDNLPAIMGLTQVYKAVGNQSKVKYFTEYAREVVKRIWGDEFINKLQLNRE